MKLLAVSTDHNYCLYTRESGGYHVAVWDQSQKTMFVLDSTLVLKYSSYDNLSQLNQDGIKWAQNTTINGKTKVC